MTQRSETVVKYPSVRMLLNSFKWSSAALMMRNYSKILQKWSKSRQKSFNADKCKAINLGENKLNHSCTVLNLVLVAANQERDLGVVTTCPEAAPVKEAESLL